MREDEWISVKDRLPEIEGTPAYFDLLAKKPELRSFYHNHALKVLAFSPTTIGQTTAYYWGDKSTDLWIDPCAGWSLVGVTHWKFLPPNPPKQ